MVIDVRDAKIIPIIAPGMPIIGIRIISATIFTNAKIITATEIVLIPLSPTEAKVQAYALSMELQTHAIPNSSAQNGLNGYLSP